MIELAAVGMKELDGGDIFILAVAGFCAIVLVVFICSVIFVMRRDDDDLSGGQ